MNSLSPRRWLLLVVSISTLLYVGRAQAAEMRRVLLPNGVRLVLKPEATSELAAVSICIRTEPDRSPMDDAVGEIVSRSLFSSSSNRSHEMMSASISQVGGRVETLRTAEHVDITCVALPSQIREAVYLLCEVLKNADFGALERVRSELVIEQQRSTPGLTSGFDILRRALQGRPDLSELPFSRVTHAQAVAYFRSRYVPERTAISVVGQFDVLAVQTALRDSLADFERHAERAARNEPLYDHATNFPVRALNAPGPSGCALLATSAPPLSSAEYPAFVVLESILGQGHASRLFQRLRDSQGIGYSVGAIWEATLSDPLIAFLQWEARPPASGRIVTPIDRPLTPDSALHLLNAQLDALLSDPPSEAEVERARNVAVGRESLRHERTRDRAFLLAWYEAMGAGAELDSRLPRLLAAVTRDDVLRVARKYLTPRASVIIAPGP